MAWLSYAPISCCYSIKNEDGPSRGPDKAWLRPFTAQLSVFMEENQSYLGDTFPSSWEHSAVGAKGTRVSKECTLCWEQFEHFDCGVNQQLVCPRGERGLVVTFQHEEPLASPHG